MINLGTEEDKKEIKIGASLEASVKKRVIELLKEYAVGTRVFHKSPIEF